MIVTKDYERLYLSSWEYNVSLIISELAKIVENNGGRVKPMKHAIISNRSIDENKRELEGRINRLQENLKIFTQNAGNFIPIINDVKKQLEELEKINNKPIVVTHTSYIEFVLDNVYYYYSVDDNPFFPFHYIKTPVKNNMYSMDACAEEDPKEWFYDCFLFRGCAKADIKEAANLIFNMLMNASCSYIRRDYVRQRVANIYDDGYHYENIMEKERFGKIEF